MAIPGGNFTPAAIVAPFVPPINAPYLALRQVVKGGIALNNPSQGRQVQNWVASYTGGAISVGLPNEEPSFSLVVAGVKAMSCAFDQNMSPVLAWQTETTSNIYFFNGVSYQTLTVSGTTSCRCAVDDQRDFYAAASDIIFAYILGDNLYYRLQRENYGTQRLIGAVSSGLGIVRLGASTINRLQVELNPRY